MNKMKHTPSPWHPLGTDSIPDDPDAEWLEFPEVDSDLDDLDVGLEPAEARVRSGLQPVRANGDALAALAELDETAQAAYACLQSVQTIADTVVKGVTVWKEIDCRMHQMDLLLDRYKADLNADRDKYMARLPLVEKQMDSLNAHMTKMLDCALAMDAKTPQEMDYRMKMLERIDHFHNTMAATMTKLL